MSHYSHYIVTAPYRLVLVSIAPYRSVLVSIAPYRSVLVSIAGSISGKLTSLKGSLCISQNKIICRTGLSLQFQIFKNVGHFKCSNDYQLLPC